VIDQPGIYEMPADAYFADPVMGGSLSSTGARKLLAPSCPAIFNHERQHGQPHRTEFDIGHAAHALVLGVGADLEVIDAADWTTKAARKQRDAAYAAGKTPVLPDQHRQVVAMANAVLEHPVAGPLLEPGAGHSEQVLVSRDEDTGVWCRAMLDRHDDLPGIGPVIVDLKTCACAEPGAISGSVAKYGYYQQDPFYSDIYQALFGAEPVFLFVFVEKTPPHLVTVCQLDPDARDWGRVRNRKARDVYRQCMEVGRWPGYTDDVISVGLPGWAKYQHSAAFNEGAYDIKDPAA
jgi:hypothetical protein